MLLAALALALQTPDAMPRASEVKRMVAEAARQGVVADAHNVYAISNSEIVKLDRNNGQIVARWTGDPAQFIHMNSCTLIASELICAASNYPAVPMASSIEWFDVHKMRHVRSRSLGPGRGSLTWLDWHDNSWWACFANYDGKGGEPNRDHRSTTLVRFDRDFVEQGAWLFPDAVLERFAPYSSSGGAWGRDGLLYVTGHDRPELYVLQLPAAGSHLDLVATIEIPTNGQAIAWDRKEDRILWSIERKTSEVVASRIPDVVKR